MLDDILSWWQTQTPETQGLVQDGCVVAVAFLGGTFLGAMVARYLRGRNFDASLRLPSGAAPGGDAEGGITPTFVAGWLVRLTVWAAAAWWLAYKHGRLDLADPLGLIISRTWTLAAILGGALALGSLLGQRLIECFPGPSHPTGHGAGAGRNGLAGSPRSAAGVVGAAVQVVVVLVVLLMAADVFNWPLTRNSALTLWQLAHNLMVAAAALLIGCLGARWARDLVISDPAATPEKRAGQYTGLAIVAATTILAVAVLLSSAGVLIGLAALAVFGLLLWLARGYLPNVVAGLQLRAHRVREVWLDGVAWQVADVGLLSTQVGRAGEFCRLQNQVVLQARMHAAPSEAVPR
jgi:hypothetical protein